MSEVSLDLRRQKIARDFRIRGAIIAFISGLVYSIYLAFVNLGMMKGVWAEWYDPNQTILSSFVVVYILGALGAAVNDTCSAFWALGNLAVKKKLAEYPRYLATRPGRMMVLAALLGGPIATSCNLIAIQMAGTIVVPIGLLCPALGAIFQWIIYKFPLRPHQMVGIAICVVSSIMIGTSGITTGEAPENLGLGVAIAFVAAICWGLEGCIGGYSTAFVDSEISITIRQTVSGFCNLFILIPVLSLIAGDIGIGYHLEFLAFTSGAAIWCFIISGGCTWHTYMKWYKAISMCGAALAMPINGMQAFWGPFACWIILGLILGYEGWSLAPIAWLAAIVMVIGIFIIGIRPADMLNMIRKNGKGDE